MGKEILYCGVCQTQLRGSDFEKGSAVRAGLEAWCKRCVPAGRAAELRPAPKTPPAETPKRGSQRIPLVDTRTPRPRAAAPRSPAVALGAAFAGGALLIVLVALASGSRPAPKPPAPPPAPAPAPAVAVVEPAPPPGPTPRELRALESLKAARASPSEEAFVKAVNDALGTPLEADARRGLEELRAERRRAADAAALEAEARLRAALEAEDFKRASELAPARAAEFLARAAFLFGPLRERAIEAARRDAKEEVEKLRARVSAWGVGAFPADLDRALADAVRPAPPAPPEAAPSAEALNAAREAALQRAAGRRFAEAIDALAAVKSADAEEDLALLKAVAAVHEDALKALAKHPKGRKLTLTSTNYDRVLGQVEGSFVRLHDHHVELLRGKSLVPVQLGLVLPRSFAELLPSKDRRAVAAACLLEGDEPGALEILKEERTALPERWWRWAADFRRRHTEGPLASFERDVSYRYYEAALRFPAPGARADGALACQKIAREHRDLPWVGRHLPLLESRLELAKDYVAGADLLRPGGAVRLETERERAYWTSIADGAEAFVEAEFSTLPGLPYRAWAYVGACCAETAAFALQGPELAGEEIKPGFLAAKTHAGHGGRKRPERWGWVELPLPAYAAPGAKALRLVGRQAGFSAAWIVVSATREKPPTDAELKERDRELPRGPGPTGPTLGLLAWYRADAGVAAEAGRVARWSDASGRQRHALAPDPAARPLFTPHGLNNRPAIRFDGERTVLGFDAAVNGLSAMTIVALARPGARSIESGAGSLLQWKENGPGGMVYLGAAQAGAAWRFGTAQYANSPAWKRPGDAATADPCLLTLRKDGPREELFVQGVRVAELGDRLRPLAHTTDVALIGAGSDGAAHPLRHWAGDLAELLIFSRALSEPERQALEGHLRLRYGL